MNDKGYPHVVRAFAERPWAILEGTLEQIAELIQLRSKGIEFTREEVEARIGAGPGNGSRDRVRGLQVIPIYGVITPRANLFSEISGGTSVESLRNSFADALADESVTGIVFDVNSPGGAVDLVPELAGDIRAARGQKPMVAVANTLMASAAYHLASAADEVFVTPSGDAGSIGVYAMHEDWSKALEAEGVDVTFIKAGKYKTEGNPYEPLGETAKGHMQELVDASYDLFVADVAAARGVSEDAVRKGMGEGRLLHAKAAVAAGLADGVQTFDDTVRAFLASGESGRVGNVQAEKDQVKFVDEADAARRAVASVVARMQGIAEYARDGSLTVAKREHLEGLRTELIGLNAAIEEALAKTAPTPESAANLGAIAAASLAEADARLRLTA